jgi:TolB-like protein/Tfp pilus assembly protein PilF
MSKPGFFAELKRRNVLRAGALYIGAAWALAQGLAQLFPAFGVSDWAVRWVVVAAAIGFPFVLVFAWFYEFTPEGLKRESEIDPADSITQHTGKKLDRWIMAVMAVAIVLLLTDRFVLRRDPNEVAATPGKSIAVLPFENLSADNDNAYFASGMQDMILTKLAGIGDLKVISRTSTEKYASHPDNLKTIAQQLGVATLLEGSVQRSGNSVLINVQLIDANTDAHVWAEAYPRTLENIFGMEGEVAQKIAAALHSKLTHDERTALARKPTENIAAYQAYLKGLALDRAGNGNPDPIVDAFRTAVALDPGFVLAWAELSRQELHAYWFVDATPQRLAAAKAALDRAQALAPDLPQVEMARADYLYRGLYDFAGALAVMRNVQHSLPNDAYVWELSALLERRTGQWDEAMADLERARALDPNNFNINSDVDSTLMAQHRYTRAQVLLDADVATHADDMYLLELKLMAVWNLGGLDAADRMLAPLASDNPLIIALHAWQALYRRDFMTASDLFGRAIARWDNQPSELVADDYVPSSIGWQLQQALSEQRGGSPATAARIYRHVQELARAGVGAKSGNRNVDAAWHAVLGEASAGLGQREQAVAEGEAAVALMPESMDTYEGPNWQDYLARIHALNGDAEHALPLIEHLLQTNGSFITPALLKLDPVWDPIRKDPRFQKLISDSEAAQAKMHP